MTASPKAWPECSSSATGWRRLDRSGSRADPHAPGATGPVPQRRKRPLRSRRPTLCLARRAQQECQPQRAAHRRTDGLDSALQRGRLDPRGQPPRIENPIWVYGLRNPFGFTFDPDDGALWIADNGPAGHDRVLRMDPVRTPAGRSCGAPHQPDRAGRRGRDRRPISVRGVGRTTRAWRRRGSSSCAIMRMAPRWTGDFSSASTIRDASSSSSSTRPGRGSRAPARSWRAVGRHHRPRARSGRTPVCLTATHLYRVDPAGAHPTGSGGGLPADTVNPAP